MLLDKMSPIKIPLFKIYWDNEDIERVTSVIKRGMYWVNGLDIREFESRVSGYIGLKYALAMNSGTSALHVALAAHGIGMGDEVIVPSFTFIATANAPLFVGAKPIFAEIEGDTYGLDPLGIEHRITPNTKAIIAVHYAGLPCQIAKIRQIAQKHSLILIEDNAESFGSMVNGNKTGSFGDSSILSFCAPKIITTGEGGMFLTHSRETYEKARLIYSHGRLEKSDYFSSAEQMEYVEMGYNFRMSTMTAALGVSQLGRIDRIIRMRRDNASYLTKGLSRIDGIALPRDSQDSYHVYQMYTVRLINRLVRDRLKTYLTQNGIGVKVYFEPVHLSLFYRRNFGYKDGNLPITERISNEVLTLPMYPGLAKIEMDYIIDKVKEFFAMRVTT